MGAGAPVDWAEESELDAPGAGVLEEPGAEVWDGMAVGLEPAVGMLLPRRGPPRWTGKGETGSTVSIVLVTPSMTATAVQSASVPLMVHFSSPPMLKLASL